MTAARIKTAELEFTAAESKAPVCVGLHYRYLQSSFVTKSGGVRTIEEIKPLKRRSCPGCEQCAGIVDSLREFPQYVEFEAGLTNGDIVRLSVVVDSTDWETGYADDWHVLASKVVEAIEGGENA